MRQTKETSGLVLVVEDNRNISEMIGEYLEGRGFEVDYAQDGLDGYRLAAENSYDVVVLDLMLPRLDGIEVCRRLRNDARKSTPVLMLTARDTLDDKLTGLGFGADDYLTKPFAVEELLARIRAISRRPSQIALPVLLLGRLQFDFVAREASVDGALLALPRRQLLVLEALAVRQGRTVARAALLEAVYGFDDAIQSNALDAHVSKLRKALAEADARVEIHVMRGIGYLLKDVA